jgi:GH15 family glucan-1,4-alpha-glucosidase
VSPSRIDGYAPIRAYAALGDGRTVALVANDGSVDWLAAPRLDGTPVFGALLDAGRGGAFELEPAEPYEVERRYVGRSNVLETTFTTPSGVARVTEGLMLGEGLDLSWVELLRRVEGVAGKVRLRFRVAPRFGFGPPPEFAARRDALVATAHDHTLSFRAWGTEPPAVADGAIEGELTVEPGGDGLLACVVVTDEPIPYPSRAEHERRLQGTIEAWERWAALGTYEGPYAGAVERSALALKLLISSTTGAVAAAPTTSLPERIGGDQNWDYRFSWVRDTAFTIDALGALGYRDQVHASLCCLLRAVETTHPELRPLYTLDGTTNEECRELDVEGYRGSRPVLRGNRAAGQAQLGSYGDLFETIWLYVRHGNALDDATAARLAEVADHVSGIWHLENSGIWELPEARQYTHSLIRTWVALERAGSLLEHGDTARWASEQQRIRAFVDERCWSEAKQSYTFYPGTDLLDASLLLAGSGGFLAPDHPRFAPTVDAIRRELGAGGPLLYRYSGQEHCEGAFLACSFWLVSALGQCGRLDEAHETMSELLALANDVGLYAEEIDPSTGAFLGNFPQGLTHLSLIGAAQTLARLSG